MNVPNHVRMAGVLLLVTGTAYALPPEQGRSVRDAAARFLSSTPENNFLLAPAEVLARIQAAKSDYVLVDVRSEKEFKLWHLPGAIGIPYREIVAPENLAKLPTDKDVIVYCNSGQESAKVLSILRMLDYRAFSMKWGMLGWRTVPSTSAALKAIADGTSGTFPVVP